MKRVLVIVAAILLPGGLPLLALALWRHWPQRSAAASLLPHRA
jgi:hypothetical protein